MKKNQTTKTDGEIRFYPMAFRTPTERENFKQLQLLSINTMNVKGVKSISRFNCYK